MYLYPTLPAGVFVDAITERHVSTDPSSLLQRRCLTHSKKYGWTYDVWIDDAGRYALTGAHSRCSTTLPLISSNTLFRVCRLKKKSEAMND